MANSGAAGDRSITAYSLYNIYTVNDIRYVAVMSTVPYAYEIFYLYFKKNVKKLIQSILVGYIKNTGI